MFEKFKRFQSEVKNHHNNKIMFLRSDQKGIFWVMSLANHLRHCGIVSQLKPPGTPQGNGVSGRRNRTLWDMVRSMMSLTNLPFSFWGYALETAAFTLDRTPYKSVETTSYEYGLARNQSCRFVMFGAAMLKASAGEAWTQSGQTHLHRIPKGDSWVYLLS